MYLAKRDSGSRHTSRIVSDSEVTDEPERIQRKIPRDSDIVIAYATTPGNYENHENLCNVFHLKRKRCSAEQLHV